MRIRLFLMLAVCVLAACAPRAAYPPPASYPGDEPPPPTRPGPPDDSEAAIPEPEPAPPRTAREASSPAVMALLGRADKQTGNGELGQAAASLERALDLSPRNPFIYIRLAQLRLEQGQAEQGEALARKSNSLAVDNPFLQARNWKVIAQSRQMRGDTVGASAASSRAEYYRGKTRSPQ